MGNDVPLGRVRGTAPRRRAPHPHDDGLGRRLPAARRRAGPALEGGRLAPSGVVGRALGGADAPGGLGRDLRSPRGVGLDRACARDLPVLRSRGRARCPAHPDRRLPRPERARARLRPRAPRRAVSRAHGRRVTGIDARGRTGSGRADRRRPDRGSRGRQLRRDLGARARSHGGSERARRATRARVPADPSRSKERTRTCARCATPTCSSISAPGRAGLRWAAISRTSRRSILRPDPSRFHHTPAPRGLGSLRTRDGQRPSACAPLRDETVGKELVCGPEAFTPDGEFILGESAEVRGFFVAAGFCAHGIAGAGGVGKLMAQWVDEGDPGMNVWEMDLRRFGRQYRSRDYALSRVEGDLRHLLRDPLPEPRARGGTAAARLPRVRAVARARCGVRREGELGARELVRLERGCLARAMAPARLGRRALVDAIAAESLACRERAALFDESSFAKIEVSGRGASLVPGAPVRGRR